MASCKVAARLGVSSLLDQGGDDHLDEARGAVGLAAASPGFDHGPALSALLGGPRLKVQKDVAVAAERAEGGAEDDAASFLGAARRLAARIGPGAGAMALSALRGALGAPPGAP